MTESESTSHLAGELQGGPFGVGPARVAFSPQGFDLRVVEPGAAGIGAGIRFGVGAAVGVGGNPAHGGAELGVDRALRPLSEVELQECGRGPRQFAGQHPRPGRQGLTTASLRGRQVLPRLHVAKRQGKPAATGGRSGGCDGLQQAGPDQKQGYHELEGNHCYVLIG